MVTPNINYRPKSLDERSEWLDEQINFIDAEVTLLDHHISGEESASQFDWYMLDISKSATAITYGWLRENFNFDLEGEYLSLVQAINAIDIWLNRDRLFEVGKVGLGMISGAKEINRILFPDEDRELKALSNRLVKALHRG